MKNAMKKLMSLVLVAILLVSAVPFQASATELKDMQIETIIDGGTPSVLNRSLSTTDTLESVLSTLMPGFQNTYSVKYYKDGVLGEGNWSVNNDAAKITFELTTLTTTVNVSFAGGAAGSVYPKVTDTLYLNENLLASAGLYVPADKKITGWTVAGETKDAGSAVTPLYNLSIVCILGDKETTPAPAPDTNTGNTASSLYVDVILTSKTSGFTSSDYYRCNLVSGKITQADRDAVAGLIKGKGIVAWKRADNGTQASSLLDFDFSGLTQPINILPVFGTNNNTNSGSSNTSTGTNKFPYEVYLNIYKDTLVGYPDKTVKITSGIALDGKVTLAEAEAVILDYYTAKNSKGINVDGLYLARGNWVSDYVYDQKYSEFTNIDELRQQDTVYINVMITNATAKTSSTADPSNPKTGDMIFVPAIFMLVSVSALAVVCLTNKKRLAK